MTLQIGQQKETDPYYVRTRYGWGWEVRGPNGYCSRPFETQREAIELAAWKNYKSYRT